MVISGNPKELLCHSFPPKEVVATNQRKQEILASALSVYNEGRKNKKPINVLKSRA